MSGNMSAINEPKSMEPVQEEGKAQDSQFMDCSQRNKDIEWNKNIESDSEWRSDSKSTKPEDDEATGGITIISGSKRIFVRNSIVAGDGGSGGGGGKDGGRGGSGGGGGNIDFSKIPGGSYDSMKAGDGGSGGDGSRGDGGDGAKGGDIGKGK